MVLHYKRITSGSIVYRFAFSVLTYDKEFESKPWTFNHVIQRISNDNIKCTFLHLVGENLN